MALKALITTKAGETTSANVVDCVETELMPADVRRGWSTIPRLATT